MRKFTDLLKRWPAKALAFITVLALLFASMGSYLVPFGNFGSTNITTTGNITGGKFIGDGSRLTGIVTSNVTGNFNVSGTINSTQLTTQNITASGNITAAGNITASKFFGDGSSLTGITSTSNATIGAYSGYVVSNSAPTAIKSAFTSASGVWGAAIQVCDGTNDEANILAACQAVGNGSVKLVYSPFSIGAALNINTGTTLIGDGAGEEGAHTELTITGTNYGITLSENTTSLLMSRLHGVLIRTPASFNATALTVDWSGTEIRNQHNILNDVVCMAYHSSVKNVTTDNYLADITASSVGVKFYATDKGLCLSSFGPFGAQGYETGILWYLVRSGSGWPYLTGNTFSGIYSQYSKNLMDIKVSSDADGAGEISCNTILDLQLQPSDNTTVRGLYFEVNRHYYTIKKNRINVQPWDWSPISGYSVSVNTSYNGTADNMVTGQWATSDLSTYSTAQVATDEDNTKRMYWIRDDHYNVWCKLAGAGA